MIEAIYAKVVKQSLDAADAAVFADYVAEAGDEDAACILRSNASHSLKADGFRLLIVQRDGSSHSINIPVQAVYEPPYVETASGDEYTADEATISVAYWMASQYGHQWAQTVRPAWGRTTRTQIEWLVAATTEPGPCGWGITSPTVGKDGIITHQTGSGRLRWAIDGATVDLTISRQEGAVFTAHVWHDIQTDTVGYQIERTNPNIPIFTRHVNDLQAAIHAAISAVAKTVGVEPSVLDLPDYSALPDCDPVGRYRLQRRPIEDGPIWWFDNDYGRREFPTTTVRDMAGHTAAAPDELTAATAVKLLLDQEAQTADEAVRQATRLVRADNRADALYALQERVWG